MRHTARLLAATSATLFFAAQVAHADTADDVVTAMKAIMAIYPDRIRFIQPGLTPYHRETAQIVFQPTSCITEEKLTAAFGANRLQNRSSDAHGRTYAQRAIFGQPSEHRLYITAFFLDPLSNSTGPGCAAEIKIWEYDLTQPG